MTNVKWIKSMKSIDCFFGFGEIIKRFSSKHEIRDFTFNVQFRSWNLWKQSFSISMNFDWILTSNLRRSFQFSGVLIEHQILYSSYKLFWSHPTKNWVNRHEIHSENSYFGNCKRNTINVYKWRDENSLTLMNIDKISALNNRHRKWATSTIWTTV